MLTKPDLRFVPVAGSPRGFSLVELMISIVLGAILLAATLTLVVSVMRSNAETIQSTRLTQELRTLVEVIGREAERARLMADPMANIGNPPNPLDPTVGPFNPNTRVDDDTGGCLRFSYADPNASGGSNNTAVTIAFRNGALFVGQQQDAPLETWTDPNGDDRQRTQLLACNAANVQLSSPELVVTNFVVEVLDDLDVDGGEDPTKWVDCDEPDSVLVLQIEGQLAADPDITRQVTDRIRIGSTDLKINPVCYL